jgi:hypothetical protein
MKKYTFSFIGRQTGAIGITYKITQEYKCDSLEEACTKLFIDCEHFSRLELNGKNFKIDSKYVDHKPTIKTYKGLGIKRK